MKLTVFLAVTSLACAFGTPIEPSFDAYSQVQLLLSTRQNEDNPVLLRFRDLSTIQNSPFNPAKPTRFLIHGWWEDGSSDMNVGTSRELLRHYDFNVILVDWSQPTTISYVNARNRVGPVGIFLASYLDFLSENGLVDLREVTIFGFSLGAHMAGIAGKNVRAGRIGTIVGLDPAGQMFSVGAVNDRLDAGDAIHVECLHTNGGAFGFGIGAPICTIDFFANGGSIQPNCITNPCSHRRAVDLLIESLQTASFRGFRCGTQTDAMLGRCNSEPFAWFGGEPSNANLNGINWPGIYAFTTNNASPFAQGPPRPM